MIDDWLEDFIPPEIRDNIICPGSLDHHEREGYTVSLQSGNYENDLHAAQDQARDVVDYEALVTGSVFTDIDGERQDLGVRLIDTLRNVMAGNPCGANENIPDTDDATDGQKPTRRNTPTISYAMRGQSALVSDWEDPYYFTAAFPTLFPKGIGGYLDQREVPVSLMAFAEWALSHHSRR